ncbi:UvrD-helicase domain-containing protein [Anaerocolumna xylanovorans]|uniref:ATP-dependent helicase/nuclease subunit A n=1 Tax=Anaerocolumna xylanovorans DSM 12503 TaxID=1121345 RepID=A0A1M7YH96_9FIRM|nr:UvrD-helicase domain-containing protein [Anaerocolumna xylanovorans]SHO52007.1 DNA helicase/exodeoxyribonuclease V, subunit A [Anaerocolumna xylanovorans DSM 12503]
MDWTREQKEVIETRNKNLLVSAAAGSGKTAVLVERIIGRITDKEDGIDIDRLLVVTFTNAAAAEMKERIRKAIDDRLSVDSDNANLQRQAALVHNAQITTIHSFCLSVIRENFQSLPIDPAFRIAEEAELTLLKSDVLEDLLEEYYEEGSEEFLAFSEGFGGGKTDTGIEELILNIHQFSMSAPWPKEWYEKLSSSYHIQSAEEMKGAFWIKELMTMLNRMAEGLVAMLEEAEKLCLKEDGPDAYLPAISSDLEQLKGLSGITDYTLFGEKVRNISFARLSGKRQEGVDAAKKEQVKGIRDKVKKAVSDMVGSYYFQSEEEMVSDITAMKDSIEVMIRICRDFTERFQKKKAEKNVVDFHDLEHLALSVLVKKENGEIIPTPAADELADYYKEIMVDEYQDSNLVQEIILESISGGRFGRPDRFMVGDVKQSIYKFRLADPRIFMEKYEKYDVFFMPPHLCSSPSEAAICTGAKDDSCPLREEEAKADNRRIDLHKNFRSRDVVINSINSIFKKIMTKQLGDIEYDEKAYLYPGAGYLEEEGVSKTTELLLVTTGPVEESENGEDKQEDEDYTAKELEALAIGKRIKELTDPDTGLMVQDKKSGALRRAVYGDIAILLRSMAGFAEGFADTLSAEGIPSHTETQTGYFKTLEISAALNLLRVIDNPRQDIPFTAVLRSPMAGFTDEELAEIRMAKKRVTMYEASRNYLLTKEDELSGKIADFIKKLDGYRDMAVHLTINELIVKVLEDTGYYNYVSAMPGGDKRRANLDMLVQQAISFEKTSYSGLFHFIRYMERLDRYDVDFGEAKVTGEDEKSVRIMSIHKSKGLEFPVVFVAGMGKNFNLQDSRAKVLLHQDYGIGTDYLDLSLRVKAPTLLKKFIQKQLVLESLGEELRVLYVALTRAKEKLILTAGVKDMNKLLSEYAGGTLDNKEHISFFTLSKAASYLDWIMAALIHQKGFEEVLRAHGFLPDSLEDDKFFVQEYTYEKLLFQEKVSQEVKALKEDILLSRDKDFIYDSEYKHRIEEYFKYRYPYASESNIHTKLTVSELKKMGQEEAEEPSTSLLREKQETKEYPIPDFLKEVKEEKGADLGTLIHKVLELAPVNEIHGEEELHIFLKGLVEKKRLSAEEAEVLDIKRLGGFFESPLAARLRKAEAEEKLYKEQQFIMGIKAKDISEDYKSEELVLVQGIIDAYFVENDSLILVDYKSDAKVTEEILRRRYSRQLAYYRRALEQLTGKKVKESLLYSFWLNKQIIVEN